jgi:hypothetical protein
MSKMGEFNVDGISQEQLHEEAIVNKGGLEYLELKLWNKIYDDKNTGENFAQSRQRCLEVFNILNIVDTKFDREKKI